MKIWTLFMKVFGYVWISIATVLILAGLIGTWMKGGFSAVWELLSPFNIANWFVIALSLAPGLVAFGWAKRLTTRLAVPDRSHLAGLQLAEIITYKPGEYCQIRLASGERVLISCAQSGIKILKLGFGGLIPARTVMDWPVSQLASVVEIFADESKPMQPPLEAIKNRLITCSSINEIEQLCARR